MSTISSRGDGGHVFRGGLGILHAAGVLAYYFARGRAGHVHGHVAAADHDHFLADGEFVAEVDVEQKVDAFVHAIEIDTGDAEIAAAMRSHGDKHGVEALAAQIGNREVAAGRMIQLQRDVAGLENLAHLRFDDIARQAVFGDAEIQHSARHRCGFENGDGVSHESKIVRGRESHRAAAHDRYFERKLLLPASFIDVDGMLRLGPKLLGEKTLESADGNGPVDLTAAARGLAGMRAHSSADAGQRIGVARDAIGFFEAALGNQADIASGVGVRRAGHHAGEVRVQPVPVDLLVFVSLQHEGTL